MVASIKASDMARRLYARGAADAWTRNMEILVSGAGGFVGAHVERELLRRGHQAAPGLGALDAVIHLSPERVRGALDEAWARGARAFVMLSTVGANAAAREP